MKPCQNLWGGIVSIFKAGPRPLPEYAQITAEEWSRVAARAFLNAQPVNGVPADEIACDTLKVVMLGKAVSIAAGEWR